MPPPVDRSRVLLINHVELAFALVKRADSFDEVWPLHFRRADTHLVPGNHDVNSEAKTATDFLMLAHARRVVTLNPSTFSAVAAGLSADGALALPALDRATCGLRRGRPCSLAQSGIGMT